MKRISSLLAVTALFILAAPEIVTACQCRAAGSPGDEFKKSRAVFTGTVIEITKPRPDEYVEKGRVIYEDKLYVYVKFKVKESWKGIGRDERVITVEAERGLDGCRKDFRVGVTYLVYARRAGGGKTKRLWIDYCTRTGPLEEAIDDLQKLKASKIR